MALGRPVISHVAEVLGVARAATENCMELSQKAQLVRVGRRGGGKGGVHLVPTELVNLTIAHGVEPRASLGRLVPDYRALRPYDFAGWLSDPRVPDHMRQARSCCFGRVGIELDEFRDAVDELPKLTHQKPLNRLMPAVATWSGAGDRRCYRALPGETLGEALDQFVNYLSYPAALPLREALRGSDWTLHMYSRGTAIIMFSDDADNGIVRFRTHYEPDNRQLSEDPGLTRMTSFTFKVFETLADLWADSRAQLGIDKFPSRFGTAPASAPPENESAEALSRQGEVSALPTNRQSEEGATAQPRKAGGRNNPKGNARACVFAIPSSSDGQPFPTPSTMEAHHGQASRPPLNL